MAKTMCWNAQKSIMDFLKFLNILKPITRCKSCKFWYQTKQIFHFESKNHFAIVKITKVINYKCLTIFFVCFLGIPFKQSIIVWSYYQRLIRCQIHTNNLYVAVFSRDRSGYYHFYRIFIAKIHFIFCCPFLYIVFIFYNSSWLQKTFSTNILFNNIYNKFC